MPRDLLPLWQFVDVADDLRCSLGRSRGGARRESEEGGVWRRVGVFKALCEKGELDRKLPYHPAVREPGYVPDYQRGSEWQFV